TLLGGGGNDSLTGTGFSDSIDGQTGTDTVAGAGANNYTITNTLLTGLGSDTLAGIDGASLVGNSSANNFDVGGFTNGNTTIDGGNGTDSITANADVNMTLAGSSGTGSLIYGARTTTFQGGIDEAVLTVGPSAH